MGSSLNAQELKVSALLQPCRQLTGLQSLVALQDCSSRPWQSVPESTLMFASGRTSASGRKPASLSIT